MTILLTSCGRRSYMVGYFREALGSDGRVLASNSEMTYTLSLADDYVLTPNIYDGEYIPFLLDYCQREKVDAIVSLFDIDLPVLARHKAEFETIGTRVIVSDHPVTQICNDKWQTVQWLLSLGLKQPKSFISLDAAKDALKNGEIHYPLFLKPRWGMGSIGLYEVESDKELDALYERLVRVIGRTYLRFESAATPDESVLIQEELHGKEYGMEILNDLQGNMATLVVKRKLAMRAGETDIAEIVDPAPYRVMAEKISQQLKHVGNLDVDFFLTDEGDVIVLEMNCRFGGQYPFSHLAGVDFPRQIVSWLKGESNHPELLTAKVGTKCCKDLVPVVL